ncbi:MAG TPA: MBL fold metallo-hydrolase [Myxococcales bacterium]|nr:MBL fold metallo-hydrolase [Myxococcales bacterium]
MASRSVALVGIFLAGAACSSVPRPQPALVQNREVEAFAQAAAWPNAEVMIAIVAAQEFIAARHERDGYEYFQRLAREQPGRPVLLSLEGLLQARAAGEIPLLRRVAWVEEAIGKLDRGAQADPIAGRLLRGLVFAELPDRFGKARQAVADLEASLERRDSFPADLDRGIYRGLAQAFRTLGDEPRSREMLRRAGTDSLEAPAVAGNLSVGPEQGFRFTNPRLVREADGVYVAEGFDFGNIAFLVDPAGVIAIDAGTTERSARAAMKALREVTDAPVRYVILTHSHWDHIGGLAAVREAGTVVIARANFAQELSRMRSSQGTFNWFFGSQPVGLDVRVDRVVSANESLRHGGLEIRLIPVSGGETEDALFVHLPKQGLLFVGDVLMPYVGPPFLSEGSPEGYLEALAAVRSIAPRRLIHGHPPLTRFFNVDAVPGLETALRSLYDRYLPDVLRSRPVADMLHDNYLPSSLRESPKAVLPYLIVRDHFLQRLHRQKAGYWQSDGDGMEPLTRADWAVLLDQVGDGSDGPFVRVAENLLARGDGPLALKVVEMGLLRHPASEGLKRARTKALSMVIERYNPVDPFRFIIYSQWAGTPLRPIGAAPPEAR